MIDILRNGGSSTFKYIIYFDVVKIEDDIVKAEQSGHASYYSFYHITEPDDKMKNSIMKAYYAEKHKMDGPNDLFGIRIHGMYFAGEFKTIVEHLDTKIEALYDERLVFHPSDIPEIKEKIPSDNVKKESDETHGILVLFDERYVMCYNDESNGDIALVDKDILIDNDINNINLYNLVVYPYTNVEHHSIRTSSNSDNIIRFKKAVDLVDVSTVDKATFYKEYTIFSSIDDAYSIFKDYMKSIFEDYMKRRV